MSANKVSVLVVEDEKAFGLLLQRSLAKAGLEVRLAGGLEEGRRLALSREFDVVLSDLYLQDGTALELIAAVRDFDAHIPVIVMTSRYATDSAIEATRLGALDFFPKPDAADAALGSPQGRQWTQELAVMLEKAAQGRELAAPVEWETESPAPSSWPGEGWLKGTRGAGPAARLVYKAVPLPTDPGAGEERMVGRSRAMQEVFKAIGRAAASDLTVLIRGETGTGKELAARALYSHSARASKPFIIVNCAAIPEPLLESELFGHEKGAFTDAHSRHIGRFEQAHQGTLFLDEIGDMSFPLQQKLLRVLQEKTIERVGGKEHISVDVRVIAATHRDLEEAMRENLFRQDLYFRLNVATIRLPPLRERRDPAQPPLRERHSDVTDLARFFLLRYGPAFGVKEPVLDQAALEWLDPPPGWQAEALQPLGLPAAQAEAALKLFELPPDECEPALQQLALPAPTRAAVLKLLESQHWPGNVRQLRNLVRKVLLLARGPVITAEILRAAGRHLAAPAPAADQSFADFVGQLLARAQAGELDNVHELVCDTVDRELYAQAIARAGGDQSQAAAWLGVSRPTMLENLRKFGLHPAERVK
jgi:two-component system NtrC family response regulator/two-component system nitrogen regulation response regulator GlnG